MMEQARQKQAARTPGTASATARGGSRTPGSRSRRVVLVVTVAAIALAGALVAVLATDGQRSAASHHSSASKYGGLPSWLPKSKVNANEIVSASSTHRVLAIQGNTVSVTLPQGRVHVTAVGPEVPEEGHFPVPATSPCTFVVTFADASAAIPLDPTTFTLIDSQGHVRHPRASAMNGGPAPSQVPPGKTVSIKLHDVIPTGDGGLAWAPSAGRPIVTWDFTVEID